MSDASNHDHTASRHRRACRRSRSAGFTLPEALMASVVLAFSVSGLMQAIVAGQMQTYHALHETRAAALTEAMLDELLSVPYDELPAWDGFEQPAGEIADVHGQLYDVPFQRFSQAVTVSDQTLEMPGLGAVSGRAVTITVTDERAGAWAVHRFVRDPVATSAPPDDD